MSITSYTDIVIAICILVSVLVGYHRGFLVTIARIVAMVASYIGAILAAEMLKKTLAQTLFVPMIRQGLGNGAFADLAQEALLQTAEGIAYSVVFFVVFALLQFVLLRAIHVLKLVDHIPVLGTMNKLAGGVLGFFLGIHSLYPAWQSVFYICAGFAAQPVGLYRQGGAADCIIKCFCAGRGR